MFLEVWGKNGRSALQDTDVGLGFGSSTRLNGLEMTYLLGTYLADPKDIRVVRWLFIVLYLI
jgi:hypothetical protein